MPEVKTKTPAAALPTREAMLPPLQVRFYRRMRFQRVHPFIVSWKAKGRPGVPAGTDPVTLRLVIAGAQVVPCEQTLDSSNPEAKATFYVTPLAKGNLRQERLEVLQGGKKVQEIPFRSKAGTQRLTLVLLALAILAPWFILHYFKYSPFQQDTRLRRDERTRLVKPTTLLVGETVAERMRDNLPELPRFKGDPKIPSANDQERLLDPPEFIKDAVAELRQVPDGVGSLYENLLVICDTYPVAFYAGAILFLLSIWSLFAHNSTRKKVVGAPLPLFRAPPKDVIALLKD